VHILRLQGSIHPAQATKHNHDVNPIVSAYPDQAS